LAKADGKKTTTSGGEIPEEISQAVRELVGQGRIADAADKLEEVARTEGSARIRFMIRIRVCESLIAGDGNQDLRPYVGLMLEEIDRCRLESWEPPLAAKALTVIYRALPPIEPENGTLPTRSEILKRIAKIDFGLALRVSNS